MSLLNDYAGYYGSLNSSDELDAINTILSTIGESMVNSLDTTNDSDITNARRILFEENKRIQSVGWSFNIEEGTLLIPDLNSGIIRYLPTYLRLLSPTGRTQYINRGGNVYDVWGKLIDLSGAIDVNIIIARKLSEMPYQFANYIIVSAAKRFNSNYFGDGDIAQDLNERIAEARMECNNYELDFGQYNMLDNTNVTQLKTWG